MPAPTVSVLPSSVETSSISNVPEFTHTPVPCAIRPLNTVVPPPDMGVFTRSGRCGSVVTVPVTVTRAPFVG